LVTRGIANARAAGKVAAGEKSVEVIPLKSISEIRSHKGKLGGRSLVVRTITGDEYRFGGVRFDKWSEDLAGALGAIGRKVSQTDGALSVR